MLPALEGMIGKRTTHWSESFLIPTALTLCTWLVLGALIWTGFWHLRRSLQEQIAGRDAQAIYALWMSLQFNGGLLDGDLSDEEFGMLDPASQWVSLLETSRLRYLTGFMGFRHFDPEGRFVTADPQYLADGDVSPGLMDKVRQLQTAARFHPEVPLEEVYWVMPDTGLPPDESVPLLEIAIPLHAPGEPTLLGIAQFLLDGSDIEAEFAELDHTLRQQAFGAFAAGAFVLTLSIGLAFHRLNRAHRLLTQRTEDLLHANKELALAAKTSAIGAVTSHLIHGLKNPLSGLHNYMSSQEPAEESDSEWKLAISSTRRIQTLVNEVIRVLREETDGAKYEVTLEELCGMVRNKVQALAAQKKVLFRTRISGEASLPNRAANLVALISENLIVNAIQVSSPEAEVQFNIEGSATAIRFQVTDQGPGISEQMRAQLFKPTQSDKGGSGIGLAISKQLANYLGATLQLHSTGPAGTHFELILPVEKKHKAHYIPMI
jgi:signal transduction histidine kinase